MTVTGNRLTAAILLALACGAPAAARADIIVSTETFQASGSLGGTNFTNQTVTLTAYGDTSTYFSTPAVALVDAPVATVAVAGLPTANSSDTLDAFVDYHVSDGGIFGLTDFNSPSSGDILDVMNLVFLTYDPRTPIGPVVGTFADFMSLNSPTPTTAGDLVFTSVADPVTVQAQPVPEQASLVLAGTGAIGLLGRELRRQARS
jgi:hypothetical protein